MCFVLLSLLLLIPKHCVAILASTDAPSVYHVADKDTTIADFPRVGCVDDHLHGGFYKLVAADNGHGYTLDNISRVLHATINALLTALAYAVHVVILKPVDVGRKQGFLYIFELRLANNGFNLLHTLN